MKEYIITAFDFEETIVLDPFRAEDVPELVRCRDCKNGEPGACGYGVDCDGVWHDYDWFCADGKRKPVKRNE